MLVRLARPAIIWEIPQKNADIQLLIYMDWIKNIITQNFSAITGLFGVYIGAWLTKRQTVTQRKLDFCEKQLREFYSPLVGIRKEIQILSEFRLAGEEASRKWWQKVCERGQHIKDQGENVKFYDNEGNKITSQIEYENMQLIEKIIPAYRKMVDTFKNNYWLAEEQTKEYFPALVKFIESWERFLSHTHPIEVIKDISVSEKELLSFYNHIEQTHNFLRKKLKTGE